MSKEIRDIIKKFMDENGNGRFTNKELIIYFNKRAEERMTSIEKRIQDLPCFIHGDRILKIETTNKVILAIFGITASILGIVLTIINFG